MKKELVVSICVAMLFVWPALAYSVNSECGCGENVSLSESIKNEIEEVFDSENGFAAGGIDFINNVPNNLPGVEVVSSADIPLTEYTPAAASTPVQTLPTEAESPSPGRNYIPPR